MGQRGLMPKKPESRKGGTIELPLMCSVADVKRLKDAGWAPVVRWVSDSAPDAQLKTVEVLTKLDRIRDKGKSR